MKIILYVLLSALVVLASCGGDDGGGGGGGGGNQRVDEVVPTLEVPIPPDQIDEIMNNQRFECASIDGGACPDGIARLMILNETGGVSPLCTGFLIDKDILITNDHCVDSQEKCEQTHISIYNGSDSQPFRARCTRLIDSVREFDEFYIDVAVLQLDGQFPGQTFNRSTNRAQTGDSITAWVVDHTGVETSGDLLTSRITEFACQARLPGSLSGMELTSCPCVGGNSGSPLLNTAGNVIGNLWGCRLKQLGFDSTFPLDSRRELNPEIALTHATEMIFFSENGVDENAGSEEPDPTTSGTTTGDSGTTGTTGTESTTTGGTTGSTTGGVTGTATTTTGGSNGTTNGTTSGTTNGGTTTGTSNGGTNGGTTDGNTGVTTGGNGDGTTTGTTTGGISTFGVNGL